MRSVQREVDICFGRARRLGEDMAGDRRNIIEILAAKRGGKLAIDEIIIAGLEGEPAEVGS